MKMDDQSYIELRVLLERQVTGLESMAKDVTGIKELLVPNAKERIEVLEKDVKSLNNFKYFMTTIGGIILGLLPFSAKIIEILTKG